MKERLFTFSLGIIFTFPTLLETFRLPLKPFYQNVSISQIPSMYQIQEELHEESIEETLNPELNFIENVDVTPQNNVSFTPNESTLTNFKYQVKTDSDLEYSGDFHLKGTSNYDAVEGISTFRGNNFRDTAFYGSLSVTDQTLETVWTNTIGQTDSWTGIGWNGQPSIIRWREEVKKQMNLYEEFQQVDDFTEVIVGGLDSTVHFYDLATGKPSRPVIQVPSSIKGSVTIDPRGYPLLYVGQGINEVNGVAVKFGYHIFSLITGEELVFINGRDSFAYLGWGAFDGNPVIDSKTDTMILPGENGILYLVKLNTNYDKEAGTISIAPEITRYRYTLNGKAGGMENAVAIYEHYAFFVNNNGVVQCLDLNTLEPIWTYQMGDDCDATIGIEKEENEVFIYVACEVDKRKTNAPAYIRKLDGRTGELIWEYSLNCLYDEDVNGGVLSSPVIGKNEIDQLVIFNFAKVTSLYNGKMVALDKNTGKIVWEKDLTYYSWSSPVAVYDAAGKAYLIFGDSAGNIQLIDAKTGETVYQLKTGGGNMEGSPAIFDNHIVIGTRGKKVYRIDIH